MYKGDVESEMVEKGLGILFTICLAFYLSIIQWFRNIIFYRLAKKQASTICTRGLISIACHLRIAPDAALLGWALQRIVGTQHSHLANCMSAEHRQQISTALGSGPRLPPPRVQGLD